MFSKDDLKILRNLIDNELQRLEQGGDTITAQHDEYGEIVFQKVQSYTDGRGVYLMRDAIGGLEFDAAEALCICPLGLPAGTYNDGAGWSFHLTKDAPVGALICVDWPHEKVNVYPNNYAGTPLETVDFYNKTEGTFIADSVGEGNVNFKPSDPSKTIWRTRCGSGNYAQSAVRKWLNSSKGPGEWWEPSHKFDMWPSYADKPGFLAGFSSEFRKKLWLSAIPTRTNTVYETPGYNTRDQYSCEDHFFLPSFTNLTGQDNGDISEGVQWDYFNDVWCEIVSTWTCDRLKKVDISTGKPVWWWLRSPNPNIAEDARSVDTDGDAYSDTNACDSGRAVAAACVI